MFQVVVDLTECQDKLSAKLLEIQAWQEKDKRIMGEFNTVCANKNVVLYCLECCVNRGGLLKSTRVYDKRLVREVVYSVVLL